MQFESGGQNPWESFANKDVVSDGIWLWWWWGESVCLTPSCVYVTKQN